MAEARGGLLVVVMIHNGKGRGEGGGGGGGGALYTLGRGMHCKNCSTSGTENAKSFDRRRGVLVFFVAQSFLFFFIVTTFYLESDVACMAPSMLTMVSQLLR